MIDRENRTFICSVVYYDIANYSTKSVEVQIRLKEKLNRFTTEAIKNVAVNDRIILDTGDGAAICFLGDPEDALFVAMSLRDAILSDADQFSDDPLLVRFGINLGPVKVVNDINNRKNIIGDGINVGQRVMSFAEPGQILVSRSYYEVVSCLTQEYAKLFQYLGTRADKHVRQHEIYSIQRPSEQPNALSAVETSWQDTRFTDRKRTKKRIAPLDSISALEQKSKKDIRDSPSVSIKHPHWWQTKKFAYGGASVAFFLAVILYFVINWNFRSEEIQLDKTAPTPEALLTNPQIIPIESTQSAENVISEQPKSDMTASPVPDMPLQQENPDDSTFENPDESTLKNLDESPTVRVQSNENAGIEQTIQPQATPSISNGIIQFAVTPWGEVFVDGKRQGASPPLTSLSITPGKHVIEIFNTAFPPFSKTFEINSNEKLKFSHKFE